MVLKDKKKGFNMTDMEIEKINNEYLEYCNRDGKKIYHLPFIIWLKQVAKIKPLDYYKTERNG